MHFLFFALLFFMACKNPAYSDPPLHEAAMSGDIDEVKRLLKEGVSVNSLNKEGATPLHWAAFKGEVEVAELLLRRGASVNKRTRKGSTALRLATSHKRDKVAKLLKRHGGKL